MTLRRREDFGLSRLFVSGAVNDRAIHNGTGEVFVTGQCVVSELDFGELGKI
jgi:hypothetical protein